MAAPLPAVTATQNGLKTAPIAEVISTPGTGKMMVALERKEMRKMPR
jgi:hypothetical protein